MVAWGSSPNVALSLYVALLISRTLHARTKEFSRNKEKLYDSFYFLCGTRVDPHRSNDNFKKGKVHITPSNYHSIVNVPPKLPIVSIFPLKLPENVNIPPKTNKKTKMILIFFE
jgi:hypothetical protein